MQTRMEKHRKYREEIRQTPDSAFERYQTASMSLSSADYQVLDRADTPNAAISYGALLESANKSEDPFYKNETPYQVYLRRRKNRLIFELVLLGLALIGMVVWFVLLQGRR